MDKIRLPELLDPVTDRSSMRYPNWLVDQTVNGNPEECGVRLTGIRMVLTRGNKQWAQYSSAEG